jgi:hypothetical protein
VPLPSAPASAAAESSSTTPATAVVGNTIRMIVRGFTERASLPFTCDAVMSPSAMVPKNRPYRSGRTWNSSMKTNGEAAM